MEFGGGEGEGLQQKQTGAWRLRGARVRPALCDRCVRLASSSLTVARRWAKTASAHMFAFDSEWRSVRVFELLERSPLARSAERRLSTLTLRAALSCCPSCSRLTSQLLADRSPAARRT